MKAINSLFRYFGYFAFSLLLGWISTLGEVDFVAEISRITITVLLAMLSLFASLSGQILTELAKFHISNPNESIDEVIASLRRDVVLELVIVAFVLFVLVLNSPLQGWFPKMASCIQVFSNTCVVFAIMYFIIVIYDAFNGLYRLMGNNNKR